MKIALIEAGSPGLNIYSHVSMGRGVMLLATILRDLGHEVLCFVEDIAGSQSIDWSFLAKADLVGFSTITCTLPRTKELLDQVRRINPKAIIVLGGPEPTGDPERSFRIGADFVVRVEGEKTLPEFLEALRGEKPFSEVLGLSWKNNGKIIHNNNRPQLSREELNNLPFVDFSLVPGAKKRTVGAVWRSRGCTNRCDFCEVWKIWPRYVLRDEEISVKELLLADQGVVFIIDDNAAVRKRSFKQFLKLAIEKGFRRHSILQMRTDAVLTREDKIDRQFLRLLRRFAGSVTICVGIESANDENLKQMGKNIDVRTMRRTLKAMRRYGLMSHGMLIAFGNDTLATIRENGHFARKYFTTLQYLFEVPLPGTDKTQQYKLENRLLWDNFEDLAFYNGMHVVLKPKYISPLEMQEAVFREYEKFYSQFRIVTAFVRGLFLRWRLLNPGQRNYLRKLPLGKRFLQWLRYHLEWKLAPWSLRLIGRRRVEAFRNDPKYQNYLKQLRSLKNLKKLKEVS